MSMWLSPRIGSRMLLVPRLWAISTASTSRIAKAGLVCIGSRDFPGLPMASEQIWMPLSSAARLKAACVAGSLSVGVFPSVGYCTLTWMPSRPISRASAIFVMSPRWPRFQSVMPTRTRTGLDLGCLAVLRRVRASAPARSPAAAADAAIARFNEFTARHDVLRMSFQPLRYSGRLMNGAASGAFFARRFL